MQTRYDPDIKSVIEQYFFLTGRVKVQGTDNGIQNQICSIKPERQDFEDLKTYVAFCNVCHAIKDYYTYDACYNSRTEALERALMEWKQHHSGMNKLSRSAQTMLFNLRMNVLKGFALVH